AITLAFDHSMKDLAGRQDRIGQTVAAVVPYFEELFGPYPSDELKIVTVLRNYSQGLFGLVTLSDVMMTAGEEDDRTVIAHELAHQWWGNLVSQRSYRDAWLSEGMANYAALLYQKNRVPAKERVRVGPTTRWKGELLGTTAEGRPVESLGPLTLGIRLDSTKCDVGYEAIVYVKGAIVLDMLAKL